MSLASSGVMQTYVQRNPPNGELKCSADLRSKIIGLISVLMISWSLLQPMEAKAEPLTDLVTLSP